MLICYELGDGCLYFLELVHVFLEIWVPCDKSTLKLGADQGKAGIHPAGLWTVVEIYTQESKVGISSFTDVVYVGPPS